MASLDEPGASSEARETPSAGTLIVRPRRRLPPPGLLLRADVLVPAAIVLAAGAVRFVALGRPDEIIPLDEQHYVPDAREILDHGTERHFVVHPPIGKWFMAAGIKLFGDRPFGWRAGSALLGTLGVLVIYLLARRLWRSRGLAAAAAILLGVEGLWFVHSRVAMLDIYQATFGLLGIWLLVEDRARTAPDHRGFRWWRIASGAVFGLALASKWAIGLLLPLAVAIAFGWEAGRLRGRPRLVRALGRQTLALAGTFALLPAVIYTATWAPWFLSASRYEPPRCEASSNRLASWACYQREIYDFHKGLDKFKEDGTPAHPYFGEAWSWPWIGRPVAHYYESTGSGEAQRDAEVLGLPNPAIWWPAFFLALPALGWWAVRGRDRTAALLALLVTVGYLPFLVAGAFGRPIFLFYAVPVVPFLVLTLVHALHRALGSRRGGRWVIAACVALAVGAFAFFYPVTSGASIPHDGWSGWRAHIWLDADCTARGIKDLCWI